MANHVVMPIKFGPFCVKSNCDNMVCGKLLYHPTGTTYNVILIMCI